MFESTVYLEHVPPAAADGELAAKHLARWQSETTTPGVPWLSGHQLAQRIEATHLDWSAVEDARAEALWSDRGRLLARLASVPMVLSHGDFHLDNLRADAGDTVALDWGTFGLAPVGADLAHLALSVREDLVPAYLAAVGGRFEEHQVVDGYRCTLVLVGASRVHWMLARGIEPPQGYVDFLWANRPAVD
ncbi:phosphotransferase [Actinopolymorpha sp. NPDC004070]|uniref:phosphotransferase n=1 Tax=Actinopolymorpha sp. NPDC004070 TaxID=3154548 RepID=UPI00339F736C